MKCEQFLPWLESESYLRAALARRHARRCESCRAAARMLDEVKQELADSEPLPEHLKEAFVTAGETSPVRLPEPAEDRRSRTGLWWAVVAAAVLIAISPWLFRMRRQADIAEQAQDHNSAQASEKRHVGPIMIVTVDAGQELAQLEVDLTALRTELDTVMADAERMSVEEKLARVLVDYRLLAGNEAK